MSNGGNALDSIFISIDATLLFGLAAVAVDVATIPSCRQFDWIAPRMPCTMIPLGIVLRCEEETINRLNICSFECVCRMLMENVRFSEPHFIPDCCGWIRISGGIFHIEIWVFHKILDFVRCWIANRVIVYGACDCFLGGIELRFEWCLGSVRNRKSAWDRLFRGFDGIQAFGFQPEGRTRWFNSIQRDETRNIRSVSLILAEGTRRQTKINYSSQFVSKRLHTTPPTLPKSAFLFWYRSTQPRIGGRSEKIISLGDKFE